MLGQPCEDTKELADALAKRGDYLKNFLIRKITLAKCFPKTYLLQKMLDDQ